MLFPKTPKTSKRRSGLMVTELIVAATLLVVLVSVVGSLTVQTGRLWRDARHYRLAIDELSNQLERLTALDAVELKAAIAQLSPSPQIRSALPNPVLSVESLADQHGSRLVLHLSWDRLGKQVPLTLVGWVDAPQSTEEPIAKEVAP